MSATVLARLLRAPGDIARACRDDDPEVRAIAATSLASIALGAAAFGGVLGSFRGGAQIFYGAAKVPLAVLATLALSVPAFHALAAVLGRPWPMRSIVALALASAGRSSLVLLAFAPALWLMLDLGMGYHTAAIVASCAYAVAGFAALSLLVRGLGDGKGRITTAIAFIGVFFAVGGQTAWILRPYLVRPRATNIPFLREREGSFAEAVLTSLTSAAIYSDRPYRIDAPPAPASDAWERNQRTRSREVLEEDNEEEGGQ
ncbi:hypothetical protein [Polyangium sorediatum]|uniref:ABC transporter permease n=1 Tax=Polyangium sorediatum TaxID=889274 RepID=A0ABT6NKU2_9BACT|nr:hypothetical protein [Polyangium sorediatum]MDI1428867.1 hypothetical protein [Polyangium sorediatum]